VTGRTLMFEPGVHERIGWRVADGRGGPGEPITLRDALGLVPVADEAAAVAVHASALDATRVMVDALAGDAARQADRRHAAGLVRLTRHADVLAAELDAIAGAAAP
jgi:hypothetical protein